MSKMFYKCSVCKEQGELTSYHLRAYKTLDKDLYGMCSHCMEKEIYRRIDEQYYFLDI